MKDVSLLITVTGPTGSGKSELALNLCRQLGGEVINCDSLQVYEHFNIGTAKLPLENRQGVPHHLIDCLPPDASFTAGDFARRARPIAREIAARGKVPVVAGGTGFYLRAMLDGLSPGPQRDTVLRERLLAREQRRAGSLHRLLRRLDPPSAARIHANDVPKVIRALEIFLKSAAPASAQPPRDALTGFRVLKIGLLPPREQLYGRLDGRCQSMFDQGLVEEAAGILAMGYSRELKPFEALGYAQALTVLDGRLSMAEAVAETQLRTRRYAKRQMTWFRREAGLHVVRGFGGDAETGAAALELVKESGWLDWS
jgi:tRNA dimethylallyltransferase